MYVIGKTGMGKTTLLLNMALNDVYAREGVGFIVLTAMQMKR